MILVRDLTSFEWEILIEIPPIFKFMLLFLKRMCVWVHSRKLPSSLIHDSSCSAWPFLFIYLFIFNSFQSVKSAAAP